MPDSKVAVLTTSPEAVIEDYSRLMRLVSYSDAIHPERETVLSIDLSWHHHFPACSTTPWQLDGVINTLLSDGYSKDRIFACTNKTAAVSIKKGEILNRQRIAAEKHGIKAIHLDNREKRLRYSPKIPAQAPGNDRPGEALIPERFAGSNIIFLPTMKTHLNTTIAGSLYSAFLGTLDETDSRRSAGLHESLVDTLAVMREISQGMLFVMDGTFTGEGPGPQRLIPHIGNVIAASTDPIALDAVAARMMGFDPLSIPFIRQAHEAGLGTGDISGVEIIGDDISEVNFNFRVNPTFQDSVLWWLQTSSIAKFTYFLPMLFNDWYWYIAVGEKRIKKVVKSGWGELFETYRR